MAARRRTSIIWQVSKDWLQAQLDKSESMVSILRLLGLNDSSGNHRTLNKRIAEDNLDTEKLKKNRKRAYTERGIQPSPNLASVLRTGSNYNRAALKRRLLDEGYWEYRCMECGIEDWCGKPISLHLDHINGTNDDNRLHNLRLLCPNCHSQTPSYAGRNARKNPAAFCVDCGNQISKKADRCQSCAGLHCAIPKVPNRPSIEQLQIEVAELGYVGTGRKHGVSDNAVRKWIKQALNKKRKSG